MRRLQALPGVPALKEVTLCDIEASASTGLHLLASLPSADLQQLNAGGRR